MTTTKRPRIILGSGSPRRQELVDRIGIDADVIVSDIPEENQPDETPREYTRRLAAEKASDVASKIDGDGEMPRWILTADTVVVLNGELLEKPQDADGASRMLRAMSGEWHVVLTSFCWHDRRDGGQHVQTEETEVLLRELDDQVIDRYVGTGEPLDKSGSYGIQDLGGILVRELRGSYFNVVGLPVCEVIESIEQLGGLREHPLVSNHVATKPIGESINL
jgi:septum formation protein